MTSATNAVHAVNVVDHDPHLIANLGDELV